MRFVAFIFLVIGLAGQAAGAGPDARSPNLIVGVVPFNSARLLHDLHRPLIEHLRGDFGRGVDMETATSFRAFYDATLKGSYDLAVMPAHLARLAQVEHRFVPLVRYAIDIPGVVVAAVDGGIAGLAQLAGKTVAVPDRLALASITVLAGLEQQGLVADRDFKLVELPSFNSAVLAIERGDVQASVTALAPFHQMPVEQRRNLRVVVDTGGYPSLVYLAHPRLSAAMRARLRQSLLRFGVAPAGRQFFAATGFGGFASIGRGDMRKLDPYLKETRRQLARPPGN